MKPSVSNKAVRFFFLKLFVIVLLWECSYHFILKPARIPDRLLTNIITSATTKGINIFFSTSQPNTWIENKDLRIALILQRGKAVFLIADACNGLDLIAIYLLLIILLPYSIGRKISFGLGGIVAIIIANIIRCISLYWVYYRCQYMFELDHHYIFTILMYLIIFCGWVLYTKTDIEHEVN